MRLVWVTSAVLVLALLTLNSTHSTASDVDLPRRVSLTTSTTSEPTTPTDEPTNSSDTPPTDESTNPSDTPPTDESTNPSDTPPTDESTNPSDTPPTDESTNPSDTPPTDESTNPSDTPPTDKSTSPSDTPPTDESTNPSDTPPTDESTTSTDVPETSSTSSLSEYEVYMETKEELDLISRILDDFASLISPGREGSVGAARGHPASWWRREVAPARPLTRSYDFCVTPGADDLCNTLEDQLESTDNLVANLLDDVNAWGQSDLAQLRQEREGLQDTYEQASDSSEDFAATVKDDLFLLAIDDVKQNVQDGRDKVQERIDEFNNPGSVALVATVGAIGGVMILSIVGVMIYSGVKKSKTKKKLSSGPKSKAKGGKVPIDAYALDAPVGPRAAPRMDPYSQPPAPAPQPHHYGPQYDPRRDPGFPDARPQRGLRRTNIY